MSSKSRGAIYIVFGAKAHEAAVRSMRSLRRHCDLPIAMVGDATGRAVDEVDEFIPWLSDVPLYANDGMGKATHFLAGRIKPRLCELSPFRRTMYVDADTEFVGDPSWALDVLDSGKWQMALAIAGDRQRWLKESLFQPQERWDTCELLDSGVWIPGLTHVRAGVGELPYYNSGMIFWRTCSAVQHVFEAWAMEWERYGGWDEQLALQRAIFQDPLKFLLLPDTWNSKDPRLARVALHWYGVGMARSQPEEAPASTPSASDPGQAGQDAGMPQETSAAEIKRILASIRERKGQVNMDVGFGFNPRPADIYLERYADNRSRMADLKLPEGGILVWGDIQNLHFPDQSVDFIHCHHVIEHIPHPEAACAELLRVGKAGHLTAPDESNERVWASKDQKPYHLWLVKQRGQRLHFYPRHRLGEIPQMENPSQAVDLHWDEQSPFEWVVEQERGGTEVARRQRSPISTSRPSPETTGPAPEHVVRLFEHVLNLIGRQGVHTLALANNWYGARFMQMARDRGMQARYVEEGGGATDMAISLMHLQTYATLQEAYGERDRLRVLAPRMAVLVPYKHHFHGGDNILQFDEVALQAPHNDMTMTGYLVGIW